MAVETASSAGYLLSKEEHQHFDSMGFLVFRQLFSASEMAEIDAAFMRVISGPAKELGYDGTSRLSVVPSIEGDDRLIELFDDDRINDIVDGLLGDDCIYHGSDGNFYVGNTRWHPDGGAPEYRTIKVAFYLDPVGENSGCLNIIPGSHLDKFHKGIQQAINAGTYDRGSPDLPGRYPLVSEPGDVVVFHHGVWHSSWGGKTGRRMFTINYDANPTTPWQETYLKGLMRAITHKTRKGRRIYTQRMMETADERRMKKLKKLIEWGYQDESLLPMYKPYYSIY